MAQKTILAVEDDDIFAAYLETLLADRGYAVLQPVATGEDAVAQARAQQPDLILMDIDLAGVMNGIAAADHIRSFSDVPIIYLTGHLESPFLEEAKATNPYGYLVKPVSGQELAAAIEMALYRHTLDMKLKETDNRLKLALASAHMGVWEWNVATNEAFWSPECHEIFKLKDFGRTFESFVNLLHPEDAPHLMAAIEQASTDHPLFQREFRIVCPDGEVRWLSTSNQCHFDGAGTLVRMTGTAQDITERKTAEKALQESEEKFRQVFAVENDALFLMDQDTGAILDVNNATCTMYGHSREELLRMKGIDVSAEPEETERATGEHQKRIPVRLHKRRDGTTLTVDISASYFTLKGRRVVLGAARDMTARKKMEDALRESETKLRAILDSSRDAIVVSKNGIHTFANPAYVSLLGYESDDELIGKSVIDLFAPESRSFVAETLQKRARGEHAPSFYEATFLKKDGTTILMEASVSTYVLEGEQFTLAILRDITRRKHAQEETRMLKHSIDVYYDGAYWLNSDDRFVYVNDAACKSLGYGREELIGKTIYDIVPTQSPGAMKEMWEGLRKGGSFVGETLLHRKDGSEFPVELVATYIQFGGREFACGFTRDITEKKRLEEQLRQSQKMEAVGTLAGGVAHDFNNILTVIMGLGNLMQMSIGVDDIHRPYVDQIVASSERAADLTRSLLAFSRKQRITLEPNHVNGVVRSTAKLLTRLLPEDIGLSIKLTDEDTSSLLDVTQIGQVLMNLATNGRDAMPHGGALTISTNRVKMGRDFKKAHGFGRAGDYVRLSVSDTGIGMDGQTLERIFEPFFTTKEVGKGTGLGLASAYGIVKQHNGYITVTSEILKGTTFAIYLPLLKAPSRRKARAAGGTAGGAETILIVEDDPDVRNMLTKTLESHGYATIKAVDGDDAIRVHHEHGERIDLIILDVVMPRKNGKEVLDEITRTASGVRALFVSGYTGDVVIDKGVHSESVDFLQKPLSMPALLTKVREVLDR